MKTFAVLLIASLVVAAPVSAQAIAPVDDTTWLELQRLEPGTRIRIVTRSRVEIDGLLSEITSDALSLEKTRLRKGEFRSVGTVSTLGATLKFMRADIVSARAERSNHVALYIGIAAIAAGLAFLLSPAGQCILAGPNCS